MHFSWNPVTEKKVEEVLKFPTKKKIFIELEFHVNDILLILFFFFLTFHEFINSYFSLTNLQIPTTPPQIVESYSSLLPEATVERFKKVFIAQKLKKFEIFKLLKLAL